ncbi:MAG: hypothetical protein HQL84_03655 [Magnetococcales bacterium]|nr:hypothetical protein [Magnetococcales bacterium]MBF0149122.1 hypothetical protein [Magnetococcales bacterium]MBF0182074.1 hypothetical protein [Magnetococcales bacterium]MBF0632695.1 hypothetical protein [Magnetococcales bacterium]
MKIWDPQSIQFFLLLFVPGFISIKIYDLLIPGESRDFTKAIPEAVSYSALNFAFFYPISLLLPPGLQESSPKLFALFAYFVLIVFPVIWPWSLVWLSKRDFVLGHIRSLVPTPWDYVFGKKEAYWIIVHLTDGRRIGGRFDKFSSASAFPKDNQIYLEEVWRLGDDGAFEEKVSSTRGIIIHNKDISLVEFFGNSEVQDEQQ